MQEQFGYAYDKAWNLNERTNNAMVQTFGVNDVNELTTAGDSGTLTVAGATTEGNSNYVENGVYSVTVNGQSANVYGDGAFAADGFTPVNGQNSYTAVAQDEYGRGSTNSVTVNVVGSASYTYDQNGNLTSDGTRNFAYDDENQLTGVWVANTWSNSFAYDGMMRKRIEQDFAWNGSGWTQTNEVHYIYDGHLVVQERDQNNNPLTTYTRGIDLSGTLDGAGGIGGLLARSDNEKIVPAILSPESPTPQNLVTSYYFNDAEGNVVALLSPAGMMLAQYKYDPFGNLISKSGLMADLNKYRFSSKEWEQSAGLYYYGYRYYDPNLQRWPSRDPLGELGFATLNFGLGRLQNNLEMLKANSSMQTLLRQIQAQKEVDILTKPAELDQGPSLYAFCRNNTITFVDPSGLKLTICDCQKFRSEMINQLAQQASADARVEWIRGGLTVVLAGGVGVLSGGGGVLVLGVGTGWSLYDIGQNLGERNETAQNVNRLYNQCILQATSP